MKKHSKKSLLAVFLISFAVSFATITLWVSASSYMEASILGKQVLSGTSAKKSTSVKLAKVPANIQKLIKTLEKAETKQCKTATKLQDDFDESTSSPAEEKNLEKEMKNCANSLAKIVTQIQKAGKKDKKIIEIVNKGKDLIDDIKANNVDDLSGAIKDWSEETVKQVQSVFVAPLSDNSEAQTSTKNTTSTTAPSPLKAAPSFGSAPATTTHAPAVAAPTYTPAAQTTTGQNNKKVEKPAIKAPVIDEEEEDDDDIEDILKALEEAKPVTTVQPAKTSTSTPAKNTTKTTPTQNSSTTDLSSMTEAQRQQYFQNMYGNSGSNSNSNYGGGNTGDAGRTGGGGQVDLSAFAQADRDAATPYLQNSSNAGWVQNILNTGKADPHYLQALTSNEKTGIEILLHKSINSLPQP